MRSFKKIGLIKVQKSDSGLLEQGCEKRQISLNFDNKKYLLMSIGGRFDTGHVNSVGVSTRLRS